MAFEIKLGQLFISLKLASLEQIYDMRDPAPFRKKDLDHSFARYLTVAARESRKFQTVHLEIQLDPQAIEHLGSKAEAAEDLKQAIRDYFEFEAQSELANIREVLANGRRSLAYGSLFLGMCQILSFALRSHQSGFIEFVNFGLQVVGWVALWRPIELLLHEWWPHLQLRQMNQRLAHLELTLK